MKVVGHTDAWRTSFAAFGSELRARLGARALRIDHIGSTAVVDLCAKPIIDIQVTLERLALTTVEEQSLLGLRLVRRGVTREDRPPPWESAEEPSQWRKIYFRTDGSHPRVQVHLREEGRRNQRYALLFRDYLRATPRACDAYGSFKRIVANAVGGLSSEGGTGPYLDAKDPVLDLIFDAAERWAHESRWRPGPSDA